MKHVVAREIMTRPVITVTRDTPIRDIVTLMLRHRISGLPVVDDGGRLVGIVTETDLVYKEDTIQARPPVIPWQGRSLWLERRIGRHGKVEATTAGALMTDNVITATEETGIRELAHLMVAHDINRIPILQDGRVVGIVTRADILKVFTRSDDALVSAARDAILHDLVIDPGRLEITSVNGVLSIAGQLDLRTERDLVINCLRSIDGVAGVNTDQLRYRIDNLSLGRVFF